VTGSEHQLHPSVAISVESHPGGVTILRLLDAIDAVNSPSLDLYLRTRLPATSKHVIVDLDELTVLSAGGVKVLIEQTSRAAAAGRDFLVVAATSHIRRILRLTSATSVLKCYDSVPSAIAACLALPDGTSDELTRLRQEVLQLRAALRTRPLIARALGIVQGRYGLVDGDTAFALLRDSAQRHNLKLSVLAGALLAVSPPRDLNDDNKWFPGRVRRPAPALTFRPQPPDRRQNRTAVLDAFLRTALAWMDAGAGDIQLATIPSGALGLETSEGLPPELADLFADDGAVASCLVALDRRTRVVVADVATDPLFADSTARQKLLDAGIRAIQSTPLITPSGWCAGIVSTYHYHAEQMSTVAQYADLDHAATEVAVWLDWHQRTVVMDALEHLHGRATHTLTE
jgi:anti-anti-sigma factor